MRWLAALALSVFLAMACSGTPVKPASSSPSTGLGVATSLDATPPPPPSCKAEQLEAKLLYTRGYTGHVDSPIGFRNRGSVRCSIEGYPDLSILDASGHVIAQVTGAGQYASFFDSTVGRVVLETDAPALAPDPGAFPPQAEPRGQANVHVEWYDCRAPVAARMTIDLPNKGGQLTIDYAIKAPYSAVCDSPDAIHLVVFLGRGPFTAT